MDSDFANLVLYHPEDYLGIVVFRIHPPTPDKMVNALSLLLKKVKELEGFKGKLFIVEEDAFIMFEGTL